MVSFAGKCNEGALHRTLPGVWVFKQVKPGVRMLDVRPISTKTATYLEFADGYAST